MYKSVGLFVFLQAADVATTKIGFSLGGQEVNPFLALLVANFGQWSISIAKILITLVFAAIVFAYHKGTGNPKSKGVRGLLPKTNWILLGVVVWNTFQIIKALR